MLQTLTKNDMDMEGPQIARRKKNTTLRNGKVSDRISRALHPGMFSDSSLINLSKHIFDHCIN
jgi:hypothetical protein